MAAFSERHGENFNQDISQIEEGYSGKWIPDMLAEHCCSLIRETPSGENNRHKQAKWISNNFFLVTITYIETFFAIGHWVL